MEVIREDMIEWWGPGEHADPTLRQGLIYKEIKLGTDVEEDGTLKPQKWFIRNKQVFRNFYMRATFDRKENPERPSPKKKMSPAGLKHFQKVLEKNSQIRK